MDLERKRESFVFRFNGPWNPCLPRPVVVSDRCLRPSLGRNTLKRHVDVAGFEPWRESDGIERWLPFLGQRLDLPRPMPLGDRGLLEGWLPRQREAVQIIELDALLAAERLSDVLPGSGACCHLPRRPSLSAVAGAAGRRDLAA